MEFSESLDNNCRLLLTRDDAAIEDAVRGRRSGNKCDQQCDHRRRDATACVVGTPPRRDDESEAKFVQSRRLWKRASVCVSDHVRAIIVRCVGGLGGGRWAELMGAGCCPCCPHERE